MIDGLHVSGRIHFFGLLDPATGEGETPIAPPRDDDEATDTTSSLHDSPDNTELGGDACKRNGAESAAGEPDLASICTIQ